MSKPPDGVYRKAFDPVRDRARTVDNKQIVDGLRVFTNNLDRGVIDLDGAEWEWHGGERKYHLWFKVKCHTGFAGDSIDTTYTQSDDRVVTRYSGEDA